VGGVLIASMLQALFSNGSLSLHELLITLFLLLTAPITAHFIAKMHLHQNVPPADLPGTGTGSPWAGAAAQDTQQAEPALAGGPDDKPSVKHSAYNSGLE
jgi:multicomponent K+:H+ antiporter subunit G